MHLSVGPLEALIELIRYNSDPKDEQSNSFLKYHFEKELIEHFGEESTRRLLDNPMLDYRGKSISAFDLTEELNSTECIQLLKEWSV